MTHRVDEPGANGRAKQSGEYDPEVGEDERPARRP
jgi:hypothetical protein